MMWLNQRPTDGQEWPQSWFNIEIVSPWRSAGVARFIAAAEVAGGEFFNPVIPEDLARAASFSGSCDIRVRLGTRSQVIRIAPSSEQPSSAEASAASSTMAIPVDQQVQRGSDADDERHPLVEAQATGRVRRVDAQTLRSRSGRSRSRPRRSRTAGPAASLNRRSITQQRDAQREVPQRLVEERRVEGRARRVARRDLVGVDPQCPRQVGGLAEQLLVPPVAPSTDGLGEREAPALPR